MKFASFLKKKIINTRLHEEKLYEQVYEEVKQGIRRDGLWAKALAFSEGDEAKAKSLYLQLRVQSLTDEMKLDRDIKQQIENSQKSGRIPIFPVTQPILKSVNLPLISFGSIALIYSMTVA